MRPFAVLSLLVALGAAGATTSVTVQPSSIGFKQALAACPSDALAAVSLTLGHVRVSEGLGVNSDIDDQNASAQTITLSHRRPASPGQSVLDRLTPACPRQSRLAQGRFPSGSASASRASLPPLHAPRAYRIKSVLSGHDQTTNVALMSHASG